MAAGEVALLQPALYKVEYVPNVVGQTAYPDPLPPLAGRTFRLEPGRAQPIWISVRVPKETPAGNYWGNVVVEAGKRRQTFRLNVLVWNFTHSLRRTWSYSLVRAASPNGLIALPFGVS